MPDRRERAEAEEARRRGNRLIAGVDSGMRLGAGAALLVVGAVVLAIIVSPWWWIAAGIAAGVGLVALLAIARAPRG
ncbi:hypothetical protein [Schumannella sp. 10F1B-5-1]|uniref:hypothetical protein n=1 Tax=Schumannella sp. 10F1B-5-1 TaxID=2590780 RepID=UPI0011322280|nr:hypothetical protein [Schumannella sp. 10F1B-5-1]TPW76714.1 hypothetical protein FJ658_01870 [Schumannella sp. 10F1B-5-1]